MAPFIHRTYPRIDFGAMPILAVNTVLGTELAPGRAILSMKAHRHIAIDHAPDYAFCMQYIGMAIASPTFIGQAPRRIDNFEMIKRISRDGEFDLLVAIGISARADGNYRVKSAYSKSRREIEQRRLKGYLRSP